jgi:hypothetical protein
VFLYSLTFPLHCSSLLYDKYSLSSLLHQLYILHPCLQSLYNF